MLRAVLVLGGTAAGLAALLSFKTHVAGAADAAPAAPPATSQAAGGSAPTPAAASKSPAAGKGTHASKGQGASKSPAASTAASAARTVTGTVANTQFGPMQVQLTLAGQKITNVAVLQRTNDGSESDQIDSFAIPKLTSETLAAQSARIDAVSGASYTSSGYIQSLQSALDQASA
jgi:uncharacterized protein with FMN-binding domain